MPLSGLARWLHASRTRISLLPNSMRYNRRNSDFAASRNTLLTSWKLIRLPSIKILRDKANPLQAVGSQGSVLAWGLFPYSHLNGKRTSYHPSTCPHRPLLGWFRFSRKILECWALSCARVVEEVLRRYGGEVRAMVSSSGPPASHLLGMHMKWRIPEIRWVADFRDLWTRNPNFRGMFPFTCLEGALERRVLSRADAVVTVSEGLADALRTGCPAKVYVIENGFDEEDLDSIPATVSCTGVFTLVYTGTIYVSRQDPIPLFAALKALLSQRIVQESRGIQVRFLVTNRQGRDYLEELVESYGLREAVRVEAAIPHRDAIGIQKGADALLLLERDPEISNDQGVLTGKVFEYLAARKPILGVGFGPGGELGWLLCSCGLGNPLGRDTLRIRQTLERMIAAKGAGTADRLVTPDEEFIARFSRKKQAARLAKLLDSLSRD